MRYRLYLLLVTVFFVTMNVLLWRSEFGARGHAGAPVPAEVIWEKVLTSPDDSYLEIRHEGTKVGRAHWGASISEQVQGKLLTDEPVPEGMIQGPTGYSLSFDGTFTVEDLSRFSFDFTLKLDTNQSWNELTMKLRLKPFYSWEIRSSADKQTVHFSMEEDGERTEHRYTFDDLRHPERIIRDLGGPTFSPLLGLFGVPVPQASPPPGGTGLQWEARNDRLQIGNNFIRVYRLEAKFFDRYKISLFVSPVGEILRMELPAGITLANDALTSL